MRERAPQMSAAELAEIERVRAILRARGFRAPPEPSLVGEQAHLPLGPAKPRAGDKS